MIGASIADNQFKGVGLKRQSVAGLLDASLLRVGILQSGSHQSSCQSICRLPLPLSPEANGWSFLPIDFKWRKETAHLLSSLDGRGIRQPVADRVMWGLRKERADARGVVVEDALSGVPAILEETRKTQQTTEAVGAIRHLVKTGLHDFANYPEAAPVRAENSISFYLSLTRRVRSSPDYKPTINKRMAWRPHENLIEGELDNRTAGSVIGWMRFARRGKSPIRVTFDLAGDFHEDIRGKLIRISNPRTLRGDASLVRDDMEGFSLVQCGQVGDITAGIALGPWNSEIIEKLMAQHELSWDRMGLGEAERRERRREFVAEYEAHVAAGELFYPYVAYPYIEWYSQRNGRVVLELDASQVEIVGEGVPQVEKTARELHEDEVKRRAAFGTFMADMVKGLSGNGTQGENDASTVARD